MIRFLMLDFGNVLGTFNHLSACRRAAEYSRRTPEEVHEYFFGNAREHVRQCGLQGDIELWKEVVAYVERSISYKDFVSIWGDIFFPAPDTVTNVLKAVQRNGVRLLLASNTEVLHWPFIEVLPPIRAFFPPGPRALSYELGVRKPNHRFYKEALALVRAKPEEVLYIDDMPEHVGTFRSLGGEAQRFDLTHHRPDFLANVLWSYGLL